MIDSPQDNSLETPPTKVGCADCSPGRSIIFPLGYTDASVFAAGSAPYGAFWASVRGEQPNAELPPSHYQGKRPADLAIKFGGRALTTLTMRPTEFGAIDSPRQS
jgi:hypothetical protein